MLYLKDEPGPASAEEIAQAVKLQEEIIATGRLDPPSASDIRELSLSYNLVGPIPLDLDFKQTLLGMKSEAQRLQAVISYFEAVLPNLRRTVRVRQKAGGNGHVY